MVVRELLTVLGFKTDEQSVKKYDKAMGDLAKTIGVVTAAAGAAAAGIFSLIQAEAKADDRTTKLARQLGLTGAELEALQFAEAQSGAEGFTSSLQSVNARLAEAARGTGRAKTALEAYGIVATNADGTARKLNDILPEIADAMRKMSEAEAGDLARQLGMTPQSILLMREGSDGVKQLTDRFKELDGGVTEFEGKAAEKFNDTMNEMRVVIGAISGAVAHSFIPAVTEIIESVRDWFIVNRAIIEQRLQKAIEVITGALRVFWTALSNTVKFIDDIVVRFGGWENLAKLVGIAIVAFLGVKAFNAVVGLTMAVKALSLAMWANPIGLIVAGVVALITVIGLVIEDIYQWSQGNDSLFGRMFGQFDAFAEKAKATWEYVKTNFFDPIRDFFEESGISDLIKGLFEFDLGKIMSGLTQIGRTIIGWFSSLGSMIREAIMGSLPGWLVKGLETGAGWVSSALSSFGGSPAQDMAAQQSVSNSSNVSMNAKVDINVPAGTTTEQAQAIDKQVRAAMMREMQLAGKNIVVAE